MGVFPFLQQGRSALQIYPLQRFLLSFPCGQGRAERERERGTVIVLWSSRRHEKVDRDGTAAGIAYLMVTRPAALGMEIPPLPLHHGNPFPALEPSRTEASIRTANNYILALLTWSGHADTDSVQQGTLSLSCFNPTSVTHPTACCDFRLRSCPFHQSKAQRWKIRREKKTAGRRQCHGEGYGAQPGSHGGAWSSTRQPWRGRARAELDWAAMEVAAELRWRPWRGPQQPRSSTTGHGGDAQTSCIKCKCWSLHQAAR